MSQGDLARCGERTPVRQSWHRTLPRTVFLFLFFVSQGFHPLYLHHLLKKVDENFIILLYHFCDAAGTDGDVIIVVIVAAQAGGRSDVVAQRLQIAVGSKMVQHR